MNSQTKQTVDFKRFEDTDWDISDESLNRIENYMRGDANSYIRPSGIDSWNFTTDMRNYDGTAPGRYEIVSKRIDKRGLKKNIVL